MDQVALDRLAARASASGFSSIAEYAQSLEEQIERQIAANAQLFGWVVEARKRVVDLNAGSGS